MDRDYKTERGSLDRLGAVCDGQGVNFAIFSANAEKIELCLFDETGERELSRIALPARTGDIWHGHVAGLKAGQLYGYRVHGPFAPSEGHLFNPNKLLLDPYARELAGDFRQSDTHRGCDPQTGGPDARDNAAFMPKARVPPPSLAPSESTSPVPRREMRDHVIYETHLRGFTMQMPGIPDDIRGTAKAFQNEKVVGHLKSLGVTAVEFLPVHAYFNDARLDALGLRNYWGYNSLSFFAPDPRYLHSRQPAEFRAMVDTLHKEGLEVMLDVVYNHTFEGGADGPFASFRGIDNASYYRLDPKDKTRYLDYTGCGNTLNTDHPQVRRLILDSLRYWAQEMGVDGFRFDLAPALFRRGEHFDPYAPLFDEIRSDPVLSRRHLIAEPWDIGPYGYQLGNFPAPWREWNDKFRDDMRAFWRGDTGFLGRLADRIAGSRAEMDQRARHGGRHKGDNASSLNFITAHDGFTLHDLVTYDRKHNEANGENNRDGHDHNVSANYGIDGETDNPQVTKIRARQKKNMILSLMLSQGTPMLLAGDEFGNSQRGNNNAYCQDNETGWLNWDKISKRDEELIDFTRKAVAFRRAHAIFRQAGYFNGMDRCPDGISDIGWHRPDGAAMETQDWQAFGGRALGVLFNSAARPDTGEDTRFYVAFNSNSDPVAFKLPELPRGGNGWRHELDTVATGPQSAPEAQRYRQGAQYIAPGYSMTVFSQTPS